MLLIYTFLVLLASLALIPLSLILESSSPEIRRGWRERLGYVPPLPVSSISRLWIHAVSVGEVQLARQLLAELRSRRANLEVLLTCTTAAGGGWPVSACSIASRNWPCVYRSSAKEPSASSAIR